MSDIGLGFFCGLCFSNHYEDLLDISDEDHLFRKKCNFLFCQRITPESCAWKKACINCVTKIEEIYDFFQKIIQNHEKLLANRAIIISSQKSETIKCALSSDDFIEIVLTEDPDLCPKQEISGDGSKCVDKLNYAPSEEIYSTECESGRISNNNMLNNSNDLEYKQIENLNCRSPHSVQQDLVSDDDSKQQNFSEDIDLPDHLKVRIPKQMSDATIRSFMDITCEMCANKEKYETFKELQLHYEKQHNTRGFLKCCGKKIFRKDRIVDHITLHMNPDAFKCPKCGQRSKSKVLLRIHMKQHLPVENRPFQCNICEQRFVLRSQLNNHRATHLSADEKKFICDECGKAFALKFVLLKHKATHTLEKPYFCEVCARSFASKVNLNSHSKTHIKEPEPRIQCKECGQWYKNQQTLRTHRHRHKDIRDHICAICSRQFSSKSSLLQHTRYVHQKISNFECNICQKQFRRKPELTEHVARHTGEVLYQCQFCPKTFFSSSNYFAHRKAKHPKEYAIMNKQ